MFLQISLLEKSVLEGEFELCNSARPSQL